jgi:hypothetical protein
MVFQAVSCTTISALKRTTAMLLESSTDGRIEERENRSAYLRLNAASSRFVSTYRRILTDRRKQDRSNIYIYNLRNWFFVQLFEEIVDILDPEMAMANSSFNGESEMNLMKSHSALTSISSKTRENSSKLK